MASFVAKKVGALDNCVGFIDGIVIEIALPNESALKNVCYNGHKRRHALKFQAMKGADGIFHHVFCPFEGRRHDWTLYSRSGLDKNFENFHLVDGIHCFIYRDSGYNP